MRLMDECWNHFQVSFYLPLNTPFKTIIDEKILRLKESGIVQKLKHDEHDKVARQAKAKKAEVKLRTLSLADVSVAFVILAAGNAFCILTFILEYCTSTLAKEKATISNS